MLKCKRMPRLEEQRDSGNVCVTCESVCCRTDGDKWNHKKLKLLQQNNSHGCDMKLHLRQIESSESEGDDCVCDTTEEQTEIIKAEEPLHWVQLLTARNLFLSLTVLLFLTYTSSCKSIHEIQPRCLYMIPPNVWMVIKGQFIVFGSA